MEESRLLLIDVRPVSNIQCIFRSDFCLNARTSYMIRWDADDDDDDVHFVLDQHA